MTVGHAVAEHLSGEQPVEHEAQDNVLLNERRQIALAMIDGADLTRFHVKICLVAGVGFFTDAYDIFSITIAATMLGYLYGSNDCKPYDPTIGLNTLCTWPNANLKLASAVGNLIGQVLFGWLADMLGRKRMYGIELMIMIVGTFGQAVSGAAHGINIINILIVWRVILGIGIGGDYPLSAIISSEFASTRTRGRLMTAVFACQGLGQLAASLVGLVVVVAFKDSIERSIDNVDYVWRLLIGLGCVPATIALYFRLTVPETPRFTIDVERQLGRAARDIQNALEARSYTIYTENDSFYEPRVAVSRASFKDFIAYFSIFENLMVILGTAYSWFALDIAFYILTLDSSVILNSTHDFGNVTGNAYKSLLHLCLGNLVLTVAGYLPGFGASFLFIDSWGRKPIQLMGFVALTILFWILAFDYEHISTNGHGYLALFCIANFFQNFGPNTTTFIIPGEVFPTRYRCTAHGISAACGKLGAVIAQILFAIVNGKVRTVLEVLSFFMMTGVFSTLLIPETKQRRLEDLSNENQETYIMGAVGV